MVFAVALLLVAVVLSTCQAVPQKPSDLNSPSTFFVSPVPEPTLGAFISAIATPTVRPVGLQGEIQGNPTQRSPDQMAVTGILLRNVSAPVPVGGAILYLGNVHFDAKGTPFAAGLDKQTAPRTQSDELGHFVFSDVPDGTYALILDRVYEAFLLNDPITGKDLLVKIDEGRSVDLGRLIYSTLPGEGPAP